MMDYIISHKPKIQMAAIFSNPKYQYKLYDFEHDLLSFINSKAQPSKIDIRKVAYFDWNSLK